MPIVAFSQHCDQFENQRPDPKSNREMYKQRMNVQYRFQTGKHRKGPPRAGIMRQAGCNPKRNSTAEHGRAAAQSQSAPDSAGTPMASPRARQAVASATA